MADDQHELGLPSSQIVEQFGTEVRTAIADAVQAAVKSAADNTRRTSARWSTVTILVSIAAAALTTWLMSPPSRSATEWVVRHADGLHEVCVLVPETPDGVPAFVCRLIPEVPR